MSKMSDQRKIVLGYVWAAAVEALGVPGLRVVE
jgi:hypothetical protein